MDQFGTRALLALQENLQPVRTFLSSRFTDEGETFLTESVEVQYRKGRRKTAPYVSPLLPGKVMDRTGYKVDTFTPALIKPMRTITAIDIQRPQMGETIYSQKSPIQRQDEMIARDMLELMDYIARRQEVMVSSLLFTGKVKQVGDGVNQELNFGLTQIRALTPAERWDAAGVDPFGVLVEMATELQTESGQIVKDILMAPDAAQAFIKNEEVRKYYDYRRIEGGTIAPANLPSGAMYIGHVSYPGIDADLWSFSELYEEDYDLVTGKQLADPVTKNLVPSGTAVLVPSGPIITWNWGAVPIANEEKTAFILSSLRQTPQSWMTIEPAQRFLQILSRPLPVPKNINGWAVITGIVAP